MFTEAFLCIIRELSLSTQIKPALSPSESFFSVYKDKESRQHAINPQEVFMPLYDERFINKQPKHLMPVL